jgi:hypothetical protein
MRGILFFLLLFSLHVYGQKILVFDRDGHAKRIRFYQHDEIEVRTPNADFWIKGEISAIEDSAITIADHTINVSQITAIKYDTRSSGLLLLRGITTVLPIAGIALLAITGINGVTQNESPVYSQSVLIVAAAFIISKPIVYYLTYHKHKINDHHRLKVIDVTIR